jgi:hypothetical protein|nr:MAG TPA: hypothetical protein [Caudoviricetes sp.]
MSFVLFEEYGESDSSVQSSFNMQRLDYTIEDIFKMDSDSGSIRKFVKVTIKAHMKKSELDNYMMWSYRGSGAVERKGKGKLTFSDEKGGSPYLVIDDIYILSLTENGQNWAEWGEVEAVFSNEMSEEDSLGIMTFKGNGHTFDVYNSVITIVPSQIRRTVVSLHSYNGSFMQDNGHDFVRVNFSGVVPFDECEFPEDIVEAFEYFDPESDGTIPIEQDLNEFLPDLDEVKYKNMFIETATVTWMLEKKCLSINVTFVGPPQEVD